MKSSVNLLPVDIQVKQERDRQIRFWMMTWVFLVAAAALGYYQIQRNLGSLRDARALAELETLPLRQAVLDSKQAELKSKTLERQITLAAQIEQSDVPLSLLQTVAECCNAEQNLQLNSLRIDELAATAANGKLAIPRKQVLLIGLANSDVEVSVLVNRLKQSGVFSQVELISSQAHSEEANSQRSFQIRCEQNQN